MQQEISVTPSKKIPEDIVCFLTKKIIIDPVVVESGNTYEREAILKWFETHDTDPATDAKIINKTFLPNIATKKRVEKYLAKHLKNNSTLTQEIYLPEALIQELLAALENNDGEKLIETLNKDNRLLSIELKDNKNLLALAYETASLDMLDRLFTQLGNNIKEYFYHQNNTEISLCLMVSRRLGREGVIRFARAFDWQQKDFQVLLWAAIGSNDRDTFHIALSLGAEPSGQLLSRTYDEAKENPENKEKTEMVKILIRAGAPLHEEDSHGNNFFLHTLQDNYTALSSFLISELPDKINPNKFNADTNNALHIAVQQKQIEVVQALLNHPQMDLNQVNGQRETALAIAYKNYHQDDFEILKLLILKGAETDNLLFKAIENHQLALIQFLLTEALHTLNLEAQDIKSWTALHYAVAQKDSALVKLLIEKGCNVSAIDEAGNTPLHLAADAGLTEMANLLIENGASIKQHNTNSQTPLDIATKNNIALAQAMKDTHRRLKLAPTVVPLEEKVNKQEERIKELEAIINQQCIDIQNKDNEFNELNTKINQQSNVLSLLKNTSLFKTKVEKVKMLRGHSKDVQAVAILPNGSIVSSFYFSLKVWDFNTGQCLKTLEGHSDHILSVAVLPNGCIVSGSMDKSLKIWDPNTGQCLRTLEGHTGHVYSVAILPDGHIVSGSADYSLKVWDFHTGQCLMTLQGHSSIVASVAVLPDGRIVSGSYDYSLKIWDPNTGQCLKTLKGHSSFVCSVAVLPDGRVVSGSWDHSLKVWNIKSGQCLVTLKGHSNYVQSVAVSPDECIIVSGSHDGSLKVWDTNSGQCLNTLQGHCGAILSLAVLPNGRVVTGGSANFNLTGGSSNFFVWDINDWTLTAKVNDDTLNDIQNNPNCKVM